MKALLITNDFPPMTGGEARLYERICATVPQDRVMVLAPRTPGCEAFDTRQPYPVVRPWTPLSPHPIARLTQAVLLLIHAAAIVRRERICTVHIGHLYLGLVGLALKHLQHKPYVLYLHGGEMAEYMRRPWVRAVVRSIVRNAHLVLANSQHTRNLYEAMGLRPGQAEVFPPSSPDLSIFRTDLDASGIRARHGLNESKVILTVGRLIKRKGHDIVIRALQRVQQSVGKVVYLIAGTGPEEPRLRALARDMGCEESVKFLGYVPDGELPQLYSAADVFVMPSRALDERDGVEGFGIVFLEAAACGKPAIGGRSGGVADAVLDGVTGILVDPIDADELAAVLIRLLRDQDEAARLGMEGHKRVEELGAAWTATLARVWKETCTGCRGAVGSIAGSEGHSGKVRVLHVITRLVVGGAQENTLLTVAHLDRDRYDVTLASGPTTGPEGSMEDQIPAQIVFERIPDLVRQPHPVKDVLAFHGLHRLMRRDRYHIVHTHTTKAGILGRIAARLARVPVVIHTPHGHAFHDYLGGVGSELLKWVERWMTRWSDQIICLTESERKDHLRYQIGPPERFEVIHSGVDIDRFRNARPDLGAKRRELGLPSTGPLVGCVARLVPVKGVDVLVEAVPRIRAAVPQAMVVFVGGGPLRHALENRARMLGQDGAVRFLGLRRDVAEILPLFDVVVLPSLNEGMGRAAVEALAAGRPVVGSRVSGIQDVISDGQTGLLVPPGNADALADAIVRCLANPTLAFTMTQRARAGLDAYGIPQMVAAIDRLYTRWLGTKGLTGRSP